MVKHRMSNYFYILYLKYLKFFFKILFNGSNRLTESLEFSN